MWPVRLIVKKFVICSRLVLIRDFGQWKAKKISILTKYTAEISWSGTIPGATLGLPSERILQASCRSFERSRGATIASNWDHRLLRKYARPIAGCQACSTVREVCTKKWVPVR